VAAAVPLDGVAGEPEPAAEGAERLQFRRGQPAHLAHEAGHVARKDLVDQAAAALAQRHGHEPAIVAPARPLDEPPAHEVGHDHRGVAVAAQELLPEITLAERTVVEQRLQHTELADRQARLGHDPADPVRHGLGRPHQLDVGIQRDRLDRSARVPRRHGSNSNGFVSRGPGCCQGRRAVAPRTVRGRIGGECGR